MSDPTGDITGDTTGDHTGEPKGEQPWASEEWVQVLRGAVEERGKEPVAEALGCSRATVHQLMTGRYTSPIEKWRTKVMAELARDRVQCPILGPIDMVECRKHRTRDFAATSPVRVKLFKTCPTCPNNPESDAEPTPQDDA